MPAGTLLLDYIRYHAGLKGTKIGCREGDCGACTILTGKITNDKLIYKSVTSCLMPIGNAHNHHIVTIEGINGTSLTPVQKCLADEGATQCGFCTPGFIVSLTGYCLNKRKPLYTDALDSINGNICRCTGYKSIERAVSSLNTLLQEGDDISLQTAVERDIVPSYFTEIESRLKTWPQLSIGSPTKAARIVGGGTDLYVQQHEAMVAAEIDFVSGHQELNNIKMKGSRCEIGAGATVADMASAEIFLKAFPELKHYMKLVSSTQIRNMATLAGNFCNASPIGDLTIFFLALDATLTISGDSSSRELALRHFYKGYKIIDLLAGEFVQMVSFQLPAEGAKFNFEKVSKRTHLDIASVNTALLIELNGDEIITARISAGGVGPVPLYLSNSSNFLMKKKVSVDLVNDLIAVVQSEISPISDARGTAEYKKLLLSQLIKAHFIKLFPSIKMESLITAVS